MSTTTNQHFPLLFHKVDIDSIETQILDILCDILFTLGIIGNILGLLFFSSSRRSSKISPSYVYLATYCSIANIFCLIRYASILHSITRQYLARIVGTYLWACKIYEFSFSFRLISSWLTLFWMFERLTCVSTKLQLCLNRWKLFKIKCILPTVLLILILISVNGPPIYLFQPQIIDSKQMNSSLQTTSYVCGPSPNISIYWTNYFHSIFFGRNYFTIRCLFSELIPAGAIILFNFCIIYSLARKYRRLSQRNRFPLPKNQGQTKSWMNIVLVLHSSLFLSSLISHIIGHIINVEAHETWWVSLSVILNCSVNFYIYCLSGKAFRNEMQRVFQRYQIQFRCTNKPLRSIRRQRQYYPNRNKNIPISEQRSL